MTTRDDLATLDLKLVPHAQPRRHAGWPAALNVAVGAALARQQVRPPDGMSWADWERGKRRATKNEAELDELMAYPQARTAWMVNYCQRRIEQRYIGSAHVEKANDLLVARRQKNRGMQWSEATSDALAALRTLMLNRGWDRYWRQREILPLLAA